MLRNTWRDAFTRVSSSGLYSSQKRVVFSPMAKLSVSERDDVAVRSAVIVGEALRDRESLGDPDMLAETSTVGDADTDDVSLPERVRAVALRSSVGEALPDAVPVSVAAAEMLTDSEKVIGRTHLRW